AGRFTFSVGIHPLSHSLPSVSAGKRGRVDSRCPKSESMKICIVSSCGGHLTEVRCLKPAFDSYEHFYVLNDKAWLPADMTNRTYFISHSERDWKFFLNIWEAFQILRKEKPNVILSAGAGPAVPFALVGRLLLGTQVVFVETVTRVRAP